jgi:hypothetical protein
MLGETSMSVTRSFASSGKLEMITRFQREARAAEKLEGRLG